jgi:hypothetical protein
LYQAWQGEDPVYRESIVCCLWEPEDNDCNDGTSYCLPMISIRLKSATTSKMKPVVGSIVWILLCLIASSLVIAGIVSLFHQSPPCSYPSRNTYESFADEVSDRLAKIKDLKKRFQETLPLLEDRITDTCTVFRQVRDSYVANRAALELSELTLPKKQQEALNTKRRADALKAFKQDTTNFASLENLAPVLECFEGSCPQASSDMELMAAVVDLERILETTEMKLARSRVDSVITTLRFTAPYIQKAKDIMAVPATEGFETAFVQEASNLSRRELLGRADVAIQRGNYVLFQIKNLEQTLGGQLEVSNAINGIQNKKSVIEGGNKA